ncbi:MAG: hypothetical protein RBR78_01965 [Flavobacteriaceae bacterium]|jgi:hypothetical protein|nr:hypothetical protein [Flavobacteriaceae bacterium]
MEAIRQFVKVKNGQVNVVLPDGFNAEEVEIIILPASKEYEIPQWQIGEVRRRRANFEINPESAVSEAELEKLLEELENEL